ncbi:hypothetical protein CRENBAI_010012 [Crenichthys baileyi]|uniref:Uncharacterized protein n=1 Tax=Crenichthys baileyi TaxID=28760 RepID=A0AAV9RFV1_9TELE
MSALCLHGMVHLPPVKDAGVSSPPCCQNIGVTPRTFPTRVSGVPCHSHLASLQSLREQLASRHPLVHQCRHSVERSPFFPDLDAMASTAPLLLQGVWLIPSLLLAASEPPRTFKLLLQHLAPVPEFTYKGVQVDLQCAPVPELLFGFQSSKLLRGIQSPELLDHILPGSS